jgi:MATE family multidrug resistance protein
MVCSALLVSPVLKDVLPLAFNKNESVIQMASLLLLFAAIFQISDSTQAIGAGLLRGIKDVRTPTILIAIAYWVVGIPMGCLLAFTFKMGASGIWLGFIIGLTLSSVFLSIRFLRLSSKAAKNVPAGN